MKPTRFWRRWEPVDAPGYSLGGVRERVTWWGWPFEAWQRVARGATAALAASPATDAALRVAVKLAGLLFLAGVRK